MIMKTEAIKKSVLLLAGLFCSAPIWAGEISASMVPDSVKSTFEKHFPEASVTEWDWDEDTQSYEVDARRGRLEIEAHISEKGELIRSKEDVTVDAIAQNVLKEVHEKWPRAEVLGANKITTPKGVVWDVGIKVRNRHHNIKIEEK